MYISRKLFTKCVLALALFGTAFRGFAPAQVDGATEEHNSNSGQFINEIPKGPIDGWNTTFTVSQIPLGASTVSLYRNGVPLVYQTDYQVRSNVISISPSEVPQVGDSLYFSYVPISGTTRSLQPSPTGPAPTETRDEVSIAATRQALRREASRLSPPSSEASMDRGLHLSHRSSIERQHEIEAITMLSSRLANGNAGVADGLEGLGDAPAPSVYSENAQSSAHGRAISNDAEYLELRGQPRRSNNPPTDARSNSAIQLLEGRLSEGNPRQIGDLEATSAATGPDSTLPYDRQHLAGSPSRELHKLGRTSREAIDMLGTRLGIGGASEIPR